MAALRSNLISVDTGNLSSHSCSADHRKLYETSPTILSQAILSLGASAAYANSAALKRPHVRLSSPNVVPPDILATFVSAYMGIAAVLAYSRAVYLRASETILRGQDR